jgi:hypothetical protein
VDTSAGAQQYVHIVSDEAGGAYVLWLDTGSSPDRVRMARLDGSGSHVWGSSRALTDIVFNDVLALPRTPLVSDGAGGAIAVWSAINGRLYAQRVDPAGNLLWGPSGSEVAYPLISQSASTAAADGEGGAVIAWVDMRNGNQDIYAQRIDSTGVPQWTANGDSVCKASGTQGRPIVAADGNGGAILCWMDARVGCAVYVQRLDASGTPLWTTDGVFVAALGSFCTNQEPTLVADGYGGAILTWAGSDVFAQRVDPSGAFLWGGGAPVTVCGASGAQTQPEILLDGAGGAVIAWQDRRSITRNDIYAQQLDPSGVPQWTADGDTVAFGTGDSVSPDLVPVGPGRVIVAFQDQRGAPNQFDIHAQLFPMASTVDAPAPGAPRGSLTATPNPFLRSVDLSLVVPGQSRGTLRIYDAAGRSVCTLFDGELAAGRTTVRWEGRDDGGRQVAAGLYFARLHVDGRESVARLVRLGP